MSQVFDLSSNAGSYLVTDVQFLRENLDDNGCLKQDLEVGNNEALNCVLLTLPANAKLRINLFLNSSVPASVIEKKPNHTMCVLLNAPTGNLALCGINHTELDGITKMAPESRIQQIQIPLKGQNLVSCQFVMNPNSTPSKPWLEFLQALLALTFLIRFICLVTFLFWAALIGLFSLTGNAEITVWELHSKNPWMLWIGLPLIFSFFVPRKKSPDPRASIDKDAQPAECSLYIP
jgi:hypothetical protein